MSLLAEAIASSGGSPAAFDGNTPAGTSITGIVEQTEIRQMTDFNNREKLLTWDDGRPQNQAIITIATNVRNPAIPDDDGRRRVFIKTWGQQWKAFIQAVKDAGDSDVRVGGTFTATFTGLGTPHKAGMSPAKEYAFQYTPPASGLAQAVAATTPPVQQPQDVWNPPPAPNAQPAFDPAAQQTHVQQQAPAPVPAPAALAPEAPAGNGLTAEQLTKLGQLRAIGFDDQACANALGVTVETILENTAF